ncbi:hypothetical protein CSHISOI_06134 [Colletotrichum shisoi]|uniref:Uncharacterized protein n=1 Tax=Colletotrichum shisoi TaxID=2078593 RepID=A0A5Q4BRW4_9PEZI|nr:hypothetical protein CSHISOI_06134 [Colletotrichum shisoi]
MPCYQSSTLSGWVQHRASRTITRNTNAVEAGPTLTVSASCKILQCPKCLKHSRTNTHPSSRSVVNSGGRSFEFSENIRFPTVSNPLPHTTTGDAPPKTNHVDRSAPQACPAIGKEGKDPVAAGIHRIPSPSLGFDLSLSLSVKPPNVTKPLFLPVPAKLCLQHRR